MTTEKEKPSKKQISLEDVEDRIKLALDSVMESKLHEMSEAFEAERQQWQASCESLIQEIRESTTDELSELKATIESQSSEIEEAYTFIYGEGNDESEDDEESHTGVLEEIKNSQIEVNRYLSAVKTLRSNGHGLYQELKNEHSKLMGWDTSEPDAPLTAAQVANMSEGEYIETEDGDYYTKKMVHHSGYFEEVKEAFEELQSQTGASIDKLTTSLSDHIKNSKEKTKEVENEINSLLPSALITGLSKSYNDAKDSHKESVVYYRRVFGLASLFVVVVAFLYYWLGFGVISAPTLTEISISILKLLPFEFPLIWVCGISSKKINQHSRLYEEYLHKSAVAQTFVGLRKNIEKESANKQLLAEVYTQLLEAFGTNPSRTLDKHVSADSPSEFIRDTVDSISDAVQRMRKPSKDIDVDEP